jgi:hypothetical protein
MTRGSQLSLHSLSSFCTVNELEKSISYVERTAKKLLPILEEVKKRMIPDKKRINQDSDYDNDDDLVVDLSKVKNKSLKNKQNQPFDMKNILGYLN